MTRAGERTDVLRPAGDDRDTPGTDAAGSGSPGAASSGTDAPGAAASQRIGRPLDRRLRWVFGIAARCVVALVVSLVVRPIGSYVTPVDGWGVDVLELTMGALCVARYFEPSWRASTSVARVFPLVIGIGVVGVSVTSF